MIIRHADDRHFETYVEQQFNVERALPLSEQVTVPLRERFYREAAELLIEGHELDILMDDSNTIVKRRYQQLPR
jgi:hypothetical protein